MGHAVRWTYKKLDRSYSKIALSHIASREIDGSVYDHQKVDFTPDYELPKHFWGLTEHNETGVWWGSKVRGRPDVVSLKLEAGGEFEEFLLPSADPPLAGEPIGMCGYYWDRVKEEGVAVEKALVQGSQNGVPKEIIRDQYMEWADQFAAYPKAVTYGSVGTFSGGLFTTTISSLVGTSGSPIIRQVEGDEGGRAELLGIHLGSPPGHEGKWNLAMSVLHPAFAYYWDRCAKPDLAEDSLQQSAQYQEAIKTLLVD